MPPAKPTKNIAQSNVPVLFDAFVAGTNANLGDTVSRIAVRYNHVPGGSNVLFMDGHVEFIKYRDKHPITQYLAVESFSGTSAPHVSGANFFVNLQYVRNFL